MASTARRGLAPELVFVLGNIDSSLATCAMAGSGWVETERECGFRRERFRDFLDMVDRIRMPLNQPIAEDGALTAEDMALDSYRSAMQLPPLQPILEVEDDGGGGGLGG